MERSVLSVPRPQSIRTITASVITCPISNLVVPVLIMCTSAAATSAASDRGCHGLCRQHAGWRRIPRQGIQRALDNKAKGRWLGGHALGVQVEARASDRQVSAGLCGVSRHMPCSS